jgi:flavin-binding protein dodecin
LAAPKRKETTLAGHTYKIIDLVGTSQEGVTEAIDAAVSKASETLKGLDWFEVGEIRGHIENGRIAHYQVAVKIGFRVMSADELASQ